MNTYRSFKQRFLFTALAVLLAALVTFSQKIVPAASPQSVGFSAERLQRIGNSMKEWVDKGWMNGAVGKKPAPASLASALNSCST